MMLLSLNINVPRYFIEKNLGQHALGIFSAISYPPMIGATIVMALGQSASPRLAKLYSMTDTSSFYSFLTKLVGSGALLGILGIVIAWLFGRDLLVLFYRSEYADSANVFVWLMIAAGIGYIGNYLGYGITATRCFHHFTIPYLFTTLATTVAAWKLIPEYGLLGAAWTTCICSILSGLMPLLILISLHRRLHESVA